eukprot:TRINITY_DN4160_c0_g1_i1.p1 TRINITY_DN4160_c0_g1~~TRINITY_DN4160_c0_g1_i1.p1  ORF type:complete len:658 (+),score=177.67 TRINITY_DN4160_c0_g1_i1:210-2183(+)
MKDRILDFPLWNKRLNAKSKCLELIYSLPELFLQSQKATKRDPENRGLRRVIAKCYDMALRTHQEKQHDIEIDSKDLINNTANTAAAINSVDNTTPSNGAQPTTTTTTTRHPLPSTPSLGANITSSNISEQTRFSLKARAQKEMNEMLQAILAEAETKGGYQYLFRKVKTAPTVADLPQSYQNLAGANITSSNISEQTRFSLKARAQKEMNEMLQAILAEAETKGGYQYLFRKVKTAPTVADLPQSYQNLAVALGRSLSLWMEEELRDVDKFSKLQRLEKMTPTRTIRAALSIANPISLMQGLITIFLARPFGARNLVQKFGEQMVEIKRTETLLYKIQKDLENQIYHRKGFKGNFRKHVVAKIERYVEMRADSDDHYDDDDDDDDDEFDEDDEPDYLDIVYIRKFVAAMLNNDSIEPELDPDDIKKLALEDEVKIYQLFQMKRRYREKQDFVDLLGDEQLISIIKELLPVIHEPMALLFSRANVGHHFDALFKTAKRVIKVTERTKDLTFSARLAEYERVTARFIGDIYLFIQNIAAQDDQTLDETLGWLMNLLNFTRHKHLDLIPIINSIPPTEQTEVMREINELIAYRQMLIEYDEAEEAREKLALASGQPVQKEEEEEDILDPPEVIHIPHLVNKFVEVVLQVLIMPASPASM